MTADLSRTPLFEEHQRLGARLVDFAGWQMPIQFEGVKKEHLAVRQSVGLFDVSHMGELWVEGPNALTEVNRLITNDLNRVENRQALYTCCCSHDGGILDDLIVYRYSPEQILVVCNASNLDKIRRHLSEQLDNSVLEDRSAETTLIAVQGPSACGLLSKIDDERQDWDRKLPRFRVSAARLAGVECELARTGYTGEDGFEVFCPSADASTLWRALLTEGAALGVKPIGLAARDTLRLEARLSLYGNELSEETTPWEAGLGWTVKLDKESFIGKEALSAQKMGGVGRRLVGFEMIGRGIARHGYPLQDPTGAVVGECTSGGPAPSLGRNIGLGYLPTSMTKVGSTFRVDCRGKVIDAKVVPTPFYRRTSPPAP